MGRSQRTRHRHNRRPQLFREAISLAQFVQHAQGRRQNNRLQVPQNRERRPHRRRRTRMHHRCLRRHKSPHLENGRLQSKCFPSNYSPCAGGGSCGCCGDCCFSVALYLPSYFSILSFHIPLYFPNLSFISSE